MIRVHSFFMLRMTYSMLILCRTGLAVASSSSFLIFPMQFLTIYFIICSFLSSLSPSLSQYILYVIYVLLNLVSIIYYYMYPSTFFHLRYLCDSSCNSSLFIFTDAQYFRCMRAAMYHNVDVHLQPLSPISQLFMTVSDQVTMLLARCLRAEGILLIFVVTVNPHMCNDFQQTAYL